MRPVMIIARNTFSEIIRDRILYGLVVFALLLIGVSLALGQLSFSEQGRISINFGFSSIHLSAVVMAIFLGSTLVSKEIDKKTIMTLLVRPINRFQFLLGKCVGLVAVILVLVLGLAAVLALVCWGLKIPPTAVFFVGLYGIFLEALVLLGITICFSTFTRPVLVVVFSIGIFLIGHWLDDLLFFAEKSDSYMFVAASEVITRLFPNLEFYNWRSLFIYQDPVPFRDMSLASVHALAWFGLSVFVAAFIFRRRDFV